MSTPYQTYQSELCRALGSVCGAVNPTMVATSIPSVYEKLTHNVTTEDHGPSTELEEVLQNPTDARWDPAYIYSDLLPPPITEIPSQPMPTPYQSGLCHVPDTMYAENRTVVVLPVASANEHHDHGAELGDVMQTPEEQLARAEMTPTATQSAQASCSGTLCRWRDESTSRICGAMILCDSVPTHFKNIHSIKGINESQLVDCKWEGCYATGIRKNFPRHVRECHLNHSRERGHSA